MCVLLLFLSIFFFISRYIHPLFSKHPLFILCPSYSLLVQFSSQVKSHFSNRMTSLKFNVGYFDSQFSSSLPLSGPTLFSNQSHTLPSYISWATNSVIHVDAGCGFNQQPSCVAARVIEFTRTYVLLFFPLKSERGLELLFSFFSFTFLAVASVDLT